MNDLPFKIESGFIYILDESDRKKFAPKLATDEFWYRYGIDDSGRWKPYGDDGGDGCFYSNCFYRRRKSSGLTTGELRDAVIALLNAVATKEGFKTIDDFYLDEDKALARMIGWQPPRPAAEVAFEEWYSGEGYRETNCAPNGVIHIWLAAIEWAKSHKGEI